MQPEEWNQADEQTRVEALERAGSTRCAFPRAHATASYDQLPAAVREFWDGTEARKAAEKRAAETAAAQPVAPPPPAPEATPTTPGAAGEPDVVEVPKPADPAGAEPREA